MADENCLFCNKAEMAGRTLLSTKHFFVVLDNFPVVPGHTLVISKRHIGDIFSLDDEEKNDFWGVLAKVKVYLEHRFNPVAYNGGFNAGEISGQTIPHFHFHVFPRHNGDMENPRGGIRNFVQGKGDYSLREKLRHEL